MRKWLEPSAVGAVRSAIPLHVGGRPWDWLLALGGFKCMRKLVPLILVCALFATSGCAAFGSRIVGWGYFQGVRCDFDEMFRRDTIDPQCRIHPALAAVDMPFSAVGDVLFVPVDFYNNCERVANTNALRLQKPNTRP